MSSPTDPNRPPIAPPATATLPSTNATLATTSPIIPTHDQVVVLYVMVVYFVVIFALWNVPGARTLIAPLKLLTIAIHEGWHIVFAVITGGRVVRVTIDPDLGGATIVEGGVPALILTAGYLGSTLFGGALTLGGWDTLVAKVMSWLVGVIMIFPLVLVRDKLTILLTVFYEGLLIGFWFIDHASALRWYILFIGIMNSFYVVWDIADDKFFRKANDSDATQFSVLCPGIKAHIWAILWIIFELASFVGFVFIGLVSFKLDDAQMAQQAAAFLPTR